MLDEANEGEVVEPAEITCLEFSRCGEYIAAGNQGGEIKILKNTSAAISDDAPSSSVWSHYAQWQSHEVELDYLKSLEIEGRINQIKFLPHKSNTLSILSCNEKTVKLWSVSSKPQRPKYIPRAAKAFTDDCRLVFPTPTYEKQSAEPNVSVKPKQIFANAHAYHINSLGLNSDNATFISVDDLRINWWNLNVSDTCFNIVDIKPETMEQLTQVITSAQFHPTDSNILMYSSSRGAIKLYDTRSSALCTVDSAHQVYCEPATKTKADQRNQFSFVDDILNSYSDVNYSADGRYLIARNYLSVKVWDVNMNSKPIKTYLLHEYLRPLIYKLYNTENIFDKFDVCCSPDGKSIATGSYNNQFKLFHLDDSGSDSSEDVQTIDLSRTPPPSSSSSSTKESVSPTTTSESSASEDDLVGRFKSALPTLSSSAHNPYRIDLVAQESTSDAIVDTDVPLRAMKVPPRVHKESRQLQTDSSVRLEEKVLHCAWHPTQAMVAVAGINGLSFYEL